MGDAVMRDCRARLVALTSRIGSQGRDATRVLNSPELSATGLHGLRCDRVV